MQSGMDLVQTGLWGNGPASAPNDAGDDQRHGVGVAEDETHVLQIQIQIPSVGR